MKPPQSLSAAQLIALKHLAAGTSAELTAEHMGLSPGAVRVIWDELAELLGATSLEELRTAGGDHLAAEAQ